MRRCGRHPPAVPTIWARAPDTGTESFRTPRLVKAADASSPCHHPRPQGRAAQGAWWAHRNLEDWKQTFFIFMFEATACLLRATDNVSWFLPPQPCWEPGPPLPCPPTPFPSVPRPAPSAAVIPPQRSHRQIIESRLWRLLLLLQGQNKCSWPARSPSCSQRVPLLRWTPAPEKLMALLGLPAISQSICSTCQWLSDTLLCPFLLFSLGGSFAFHKNF